MSCSGKVFCFLPAGCIGCQRLEVLCQRFPNVNFTTNVKFQSWNIQSLLSNPVGGNNLWPWPYWACVSVHPSFHPWIVSGMLFAMDTAIEFIFGIQVYDCYRSYKLSLCFCFVQLISSGVMVLKHPRIYFCHGYGADFSHAGVWWIVTEAWEGVQVLFCSVDSSDIRALECRSFYSTCIS